MSEPVQTVFVLGAGFSVEEQYPLVRAMKDQVLHFLEAERHSAYRVFLESGNGGYERGQFYAGLETVDQDGSLQFEELLLALSSRLKQAIPADPAHVTARVLRIGAARLFWAIHNSIWQVAPSYHNFAEWLGLRDADNSVVSFNWDIQTELLLTQARVPWSYSRTSGVPIIKPHGSITWSGHLREGLVAEYANWRRIAPESKFSYDSSNPLSNPFKQGINTQLNYMIFPGDPELPDGDNDVALIWHDAAELIRDAERIVFIGYSLPDYDSYATSFFKDVARGTEIVVINPSEEHLNRFRSFLGDSVQLRKERFRDCAYGSSGPPT